ncbi:hypothetical protein DB31_4410 [Hyalangium minutum]|uniref:Uncharacterized protein n=1 Tax=Hyalangium minutum TaxID=394096 RepID=A0A085W2Q4_9BACT|nr:hypothetical protein DB31_4410 [Hyalangium minutum]
MGVSERAPLHARRGEEECPMSAGRGISPQTQPETRTRE